MEIDVAVGKFRHARTWRNLIMPWSDLVERCSKTTRTVEKFSEYLKFPKTRRDEIKDVGAFVGGFLDRGKRTKDAVLNRQVITLDADYAKPGLWADYLSIFGAAGFVYSTHSHHPDKPRLRIVILADRPMDKDEYEPVCRYVTSTLGINQFDHTTYDVNRLMYWPSTAADGEFIFEECKGEPLAVDNILLTYRNFRDASTWPVGDIENHAIKTGIDRQGEPTEKPGTIGLFCRTFSITEAIAEFLPDIYDTCDVENRYTYRDGSTSGGLIVYDDKFAYSHHGTDPISEKLVNAFDLVRIHKFGHLDENARPDTPVNRLQSYTAMTSFALGHKDVKRLGMAERLDEMKADFKDVLFSEEDLNWMERLAMDKHGNVHPTYENLGTILRNDPALKGRFRFNEFSGSIDVQHPTPWNPRPELKPIEEDDRCGLRVYIGQEPYAISAAPKLADQLPLVAKENAYHPIKEYLEGLRWDGEHRVDTLLTDFLGAEDNALNRAFIRKTLCAAVKRLYAPGTKFDEVLTLVGGEGTRKSTFAKSLGLDWFSDTFNFGMLTGGNGIRAYEQLECVWIIEVPEMAGMRKAELEMAKSFLGASEDRYRGSHKEDTKLRKRTNIFIGTTNNHQFLTGQTGNRRFWPVVVHVRPPRIPIPGEVIDRAVVDQIWAEVMTMYEDEPLQLSKGLALQAKQLQQAHTEVEETDGLVARFLDMPLPVSWDTMQAHQRAAFFDFGFEEYTGETRPRTRVCVAEIWCEALNRRIGDLTVQHSRKLHALMKSLSDEWEGPVSGRYGVYGQQRGYVRRAGAKKFVNTPNEG